MLATLEKWLTAPPWKVALLILIITLSVASLALAEDPLPPDQYQTVIDAINNAAWSIIGTLWALIFAVTWKG